MAIRKNVISMSLSDYVHYIRGVKKSGKSTLFRDLVLLEHGTEDAGLLISFGDEDGYKSLDKLQFEVIEEWDMDEDENGNRGFIQLVDDLVENNDSIGIKMICYDTIDKLLEVATKEILRQSLIETGMVCKSLNAAFGGYGRGKERLIKLIQEQTFKLKKIGLNPIILGHTKYKDKTDPITGIEYSQLTSSLTADLDAIFGDTAQMVMTISIDKIIEDGKLIDTKRMMHFRDDGLVDCGSRFAGLPDSLPLSAENYMVAFKQGVQSSFLDSKNQTETKKEVIVKKQEEVKVEETKPEIKETIVEEKTLPELIKEINTVIKKRNKDTPKDDPFYLGSKAVMEIFKPYGIKQPKELLSVEDAEAVLKALS